MNIICAQLNYTLGDFSGNLSKIKEVLTQHGQSADMIIFSELCLSGYYPLDLIERADFIADHDLCLLELLQLSKTCAAAIIVGAIDKNTGAGKAYFNALLVIYQGEVVYRYYKQLLPVYNIFNEARHFEPGKAPGIFQFKGKHFGFLICEDAWAGTENALYHADPVLELEKQAIDCIISINGSPSNIDKQQERLAHFSIIAKRVGAPLIFTNQVGGHDEIVFDGASFVLDAEGKMIAQLPAFDVGVGGLSLTKEIRVKAGWQSPFELTGPAFYFEQILLGLRDYARRCHASGAIIALSGGIDSAITLALAVKVLGAQNVTALFLPSKYSSSQSEQDAKALADTLGVKLYTRSIQSEFDLAITHFEQTFGEPPSDLTQQNMQARLRGRIVMEYSNQTGYLVISTGNKSEISVGFTTLYGDMTGGFNLIGDLYKMEVYALARYYNQQWPDIPIPKTIIERAPTPELAANQTDQDNLPPYEQLDAVLKLYIEGDLLSPEEHQYYASIANHLPDSEIKRLHTLVDKAEFKRRQACPIIRIQKRAFGIGRQFPIARHYK